jgi:hypothetical protein
MYRHEASVRLLAVSRRRRAQRNARRALERELAGYSTDADRNDLELLAAATRPVADEVAAILGEQAGAVGTRPVTDEVSAILGRQAEARLYRVG